MSSDTKPSVPRPIIPREDGPVEKPTRRIEPPPDWAIALKEQMENGFRGIRADYALLTNDFGLLRDRVIILENARNLEDERAAKHSGGFRQLSDSDHKQDAAIANIVTEVTGLKKSQEAQTAEIAATKALVVAGNADTADLKRELIDGVKSFWKRHPRLETALVGLLLAAFALATAWLAGRMH